MAVLNSTILADVWDRGSWDFQQRVSDPSIHGIAAMVSDVFDPQNGKLFNEFTGLLNGNFGTYVESKRFENPLRVLKKPAAPAFGNVERRIAVNYMRAHAYRPDSETLLKYESPEFVEWWYSTSRKERYSFTWDRADLMRAFDSEGYGYNELLMATLDQQISSDNYDEMNSMLDVIPEADRRWGLFRHTVTGDMASKEVAQELLAQIRAYGGMMKYPSRRFNHIPVPVHETPDTLILMVDPLVRAYLDVYALAEFFQIDRAEVPYRIIEVPQFPLPGVRAALMSEDFIYARDVLYGVYPSDLRPDTLTLKYYLHHHSIIGANPAAQCVLFTEEGESTLTSTVTVTPNALAFNPSNATAAPGETVQLNLELRGTVEGDTEAAGMIAVEPDTALFTVSAVRAGESGDEAVALNSRTFVDRLGRLHVQKTGLNVGDVITVDAESAYINPSGETPNLTASASVTIVQPTDAGYKDNPVDVEPFIDYDVATEVQKA